MLWNETGREALAGAAEGIRYLSFRIYEKTGRMDTRPLVVVHGPCSAVAPRGVHPVSYRKGDLEIPHGLHHLLAVIAARSKNSHISVPSLTNHFLKINQLLAAYRTRTAAVKKKKTPFSA
jgi:hypothetical protein